MRCRECTGLNFSVRTPLFFLVNVVWIRSGVLGREETMTGSELWLVCRSIWADKVFFSFDCPLSRTSVRTLQKTQQFPSTKNKFQMRFGVIIGVYCKNHSCNEKWSLWIRSIVKKFNTWPYLFMFRVLIFIFTLWQYFNKVERVRFGKIFGSHFGGTAWGSMQYHVACVLKRIVCSRTEENHRKPWWNIHSRTDV